MTPPNDPPLQIILQQFRAELKEVTAELKQLNEGQKQFAACLENSQRAVARLGAEVAELKANVVTREELAAFTSSIEERLARYETVQWFDKTINRTGYRPEPTRWEPSGELLIEHADTFARYPSPYRR